MVSIKDIMHDCPDFMVPQYIGDARVYENITNWALGELYNIHQPKLWIHGHYHISKTTKYGNTKFVGEGTVTDEIKDDLLKLGWRIESYE